MKQTFQVCKFALTLFVLVANVAVGLWTAAPARAETHAQMQQRVLNEILAQHADVLKQCDAACVEGWLVGAPWLRLFAERNSLPVDDVVKAAISWNFEWGVQFETTHAANTDCRARSTLQDNKCAPTIYDWQTAYADNGEAFRARFDATPMLFKVNDWSERRYFRLSQEYGGLY